MKQTKVNQIIPKTGITYIQGQILVAVRVRAREIKLI